LRSILGRVPYAVNRGLAAALPCALAASAATLLAASVSGLHCSALLLGPPPAPSQRVQSPSAMGVDTYGSLEGRVILVTGATSGMGLTSAQMLAQNGAKVAMCGRRSDVGEREAAAIRDAGGDATFFLCDVGQEADCVRVVAQTVERYGRLDGAFNNAGVSGGNWESTSAEDYDSIMDINVRGVFFCMREQVAQLRKQGSKGSIINCGSTNAHRAAAAQSLTYTTSKHAVSGLSKQAAVEYGRFGIRVNTLSPGWIPTEMTSRIKEVDGLEEHFAKYSPMERWGTTEEIASTVCFLLSDSASFINGVDLLVDGGMCQSEPPGGACVCVRSCRLVSLSESCSQSSRLRFASCFLSATLPLHRA